MLIKTSDTLIIASAPPIKTKLFLFFYNVSANVIHTKVVHFQMININGKSHCMHIHTLLNVSTLQSPALIDKSNQASSYSKISHDVLWLFTWLEGYVRLNLNIPLFQKRTCRC
jgi:hypothetical protein